MVRTSGRNKSKSGNNTDGKVKKQCKDPEEVISSSQPIEPTEEITGKSRTLNTGYSRKHAYLFIIAGFLAPDPPLSQPILDYEVTAAESGSTRLLRDRYAAEQKSGMECLDETTVEEAPNNPPLFHEACRVHEVFYTFNSNKLFHYPFRVWHICITLAEWHMFQTCLRHLLFI